MKVTSVGHAGLHLETAAGTILCDPWLYPAYYASWFVFPDNSALDWDALGDCDYLYVSHLHHDHFDAENLARHVNKSATVLLPDFPVDDLADAAPRGGLHPVRARPERHPRRARRNARDDQRAHRPQRRTARRLGPGGGRRHRRAAQPERCSAVGVRHASRFAGDAGYDAHLLQFSGAIWWPMVYDLPAKTAACIGADKRVNGMERSLRYASDIHAAFVFPSAGPPCFLDDDLFAVQRHRPRSDQRVPRCHGVPRVPRRAWPRQRTAPHPRFDRRGARRRRHAGVIRHLHRHPPDDRRRGHSHLHGQGHLPG